MKFEAARIQFSGDVLAAVANEGRRGRGVGSGKRAKQAQGPVVRRPIGANPGLNFNPGRFFFWSKAFSPTIFSILFRVANHQIVDKKN